MREILTIDSEKLTKFNDGRLQAHLENKCAFCHHKLTDLRRIYCDSRCRISFRKKNEYITNSWRSVRSKTLRRDHFLCVLCLKEGKRTRSREVDHIIEIADGGAEFELSNTQTICKEHHQIKTNENRTRRSEDRKQVQLADQKNHS